MAFDAGMLSAVCAELNQKIIGARVEKVYQPTRDELVLVLRPEKGGESLRLLCCVGGVSPRVNLTSLEIANPPSPPSFTQLLRKHLSGAKILSVRQLGFERAAEISLEAHDDMNFKAVKYLFLEIMGKYSNIIFCNSERKVIGAIKTVDFTTSSKRQIIPGITYEEPPKQDRQNPLETEKEDFMLKYEKNTDTDEKFIMSVFAGFSPAVAREIAKDADGNAARLWQNFSRVVNAVRNGDYTPTLILDENGKPVEYSFINLTHYGNNIKTIHPESFGKLIDDYYFTRERLERIKQRSGDVMKMLDNAKVRLSKKLINLKSDLASCADKDRYKRYGDLITYNMNLIEKGSKVAEIVDYFDESLPTVKVPLDYKLSPSQNAQKYYKKYNKMKHGETEIARQMEIAEKELEYLETVSEAFFLCENETDIAEIRRELYESGYASRMKNYTPSKQSRPRVLEFVTTNGYRVVCGKNNIQNETVTHKIASKNDYWFHTKNYHGSHAVMICNGEEPPAEDFTDAAMIAAYYSSARDGKNVDVDYTKVRNLKKPTNSKPGFVVYHTNYTATVTPKREIIEKLRKK